MKPTINIEQKLLQNLRLLPPDKQQEFLDFVQFLVQRSQQVNLLQNAPFDASISSTEPTLPKRSFRDFLTRILEAHKILEQSLELTTQQDLTAVQLTEFFVLDGEDYLINPAITRSHDAFLQGYAPEDEGLYDDYWTGVIFGWQIFLLQTAPTLKNAPYFCCGWMARMW